MLLGFISVSFSECPPLSPPASLLIGRYLLCSFKPCSQLQAAYTWHWVIPAVGSGPGGLNHPDLARPAKGPPSMNFQARSIPDAGGHGHPTGARPSGQPFPLPAVGNSAGGGSLPSCNPRGLVRTRGRCHAWGPRGVVDAGTPFLGGGART